MKDFRVKPRMFGSSFLLIERCIENSLPDVFKKFMYKYAGLSLEEEYFLDLNGTGRIVKTFLRSNEVYDFTKQLKANNFGLKVPFAMDEGGWTYCLSFDKESFEKIVINRWYDYSQEERFLVVSNSFEEFINNLQVRPEHLK